MHTNTFSLLKYVPGMFILSLLMLSACSKDELLSAVGLLEWDRVELVAETNEPIMEITAREGDVLESGTIILQQDARRVQAKLDESQAMLAQARARLAELVRGPRAEQVDAARANLEGARVIGDRPRLPIVC